MKTMFLSYSSKDHAIASGLKDALVSHGHQVWFDQDMIAGGEHYADRIPKGLKNAELFLLLCTKHSMGDARVNLSGSREVIKEIELAQRYGCKIIRLKADDTPDEAFDSAYEYHLSVMQWIDICAAVSLQDYAPVVSHIVGKETELSNESIEVYYLKEAIKALKVAHTGKALKILEHQHFNECNAEEARFLLVMAKLQSKVKLASLSHLTKTQADNFVSALSQHLSTNMAPAAAYCLALLSRFYYQANFIADATPGFDKLKAFGKHNEKVKAKYKLIAETFLPVNNSFSVDWDF